MKPLYHYDHKARRYYVTVADAAHLTRIPERTIRHWVAQGRLTRHGDCKPCLVSLPEVHELAEIMAARRRVRLPRVRYTLSLSGAVSPQGAAPN